MPWMFSSPFVCVVGKSMVDNRPGVLVVSLVGSAVTRCAWVVLTTIGGRVGLVTRAGPRVVRGACVGTVVATVMICGLVGLLGVCGCGGVVTSADGPTGLVGGGVVSCWFGKDVVRTTFGFEPEKQMM